MRSDDLVKKMTEVVEELGQDVRDLERDLQRFPDESDVRTTRRLLRRKRRTLREARLLLSIYLERSRGWDQADCQTERGPHRRGERTHEDTCTVTRTA